ncbi:Cell adhesion molecule Dscam2 [Dirofilaria immitis]
MSILILIAATLKAFTVLPYVQIDFVHYFRLAQCDAKCAEKYSKSIKRRLNDGTFVKYYGNDGEHYKLCVAGCNRRRMISRREKNGTTNALSMGMKFWMDTNAYASRTENSPIKSVQLGCMDIVTSHEHNDFEDTIEGLIFMNINETEQYPIRYIVQWKQRTYDGSPTEENGWITASIESEPIFKVEGMIPVMQYRFMITAIGPGGRMGGPIMSNWAQLLTIDEKLRIPVGPMIITTQYNNVDGLCALVKWYHSPYQRELSTDILDDSLALYGSCHYNITIFNETSQETVLFTLDNGNGILLSNLQFSTEYSVIVRSISTIGEDSSMMYQKNMSNIGDTNGLLENRFLTPACNEIFGSGSLECAPEPVRNLEAMVNSNGSVKIQWIPSSEPNAILVYQLLYQSLTNHYDCDNGPSSIYINAGSTTATIQLHGQTHCEYSIKLINYDLIGREANTATTNSNSNHSILLSDSDKKNTVTIL